MEYMALLCIEGFFGTYKALLKEYRALSIEYRAFLIEYRCAGGIYRALFYMQGSFLYTGLF